MSKASFCPLSCSRQGETKHSSDLSSFEEQFREGMATILKPAGACLKSRSNHSPGCVHEPGSCGLLAAPQQKKAHRARKQRQRGVYEPPHQGDGIRPHSGKTGIPDIEPVPEK